MPNLTEKKYTGEFIATEAPGRISRDVVVLAQGNVVQAGDVLGIITANGKRVPVAPGASDGSQVAAEIAYDNTDTSATGTNADTKIVVLARTCEVNGAELGWGTLNGGQITTATAQLKAAGILVRAAV